MEDEHLDTIPVTESANIIKSSVEDLVPTPSESADLSDGERECDFDYLLEEFSGKLAHTDPIPPGVVDTDSEPEEEIRLAENLSYDNSSPRPPEERNSKIADTIVKFLSPPPIPVEDSDSLMEEIDLFLASDDSMPPGIEIDDYDSEGDIRFLEELLSSDSLPLPENESFSLNHFDDPSLPRLLRNHGCVMICSLICTDLRACCYYISAKTGWLFVLSAGRFSVGLMYVVDDEVAHQLISVGWLVLWDFDRKSRFWIVHKTEASVLSMKRLIPWLEIRNRTRSLGVAAYSLRFTRSHATDVVRLLWCVGLDAWSVARTITADNRTLTMQGDLSLSWTQAVVPMGQLGLMAQPSLGSVGGWPQTPKGCLIACLHQATPPRGRCPRNTIITPGATPHWLVAQLVSRSGCCVWVRALPDPAAPPGEWKKKGEASGACHTPPRRPCQGHAIPPKPELKRKKWKEK
ncbi:hypothetical protein Tco_0494074 [Tanacetum coccineum]